VAVSDLDRSLLRKLAEWTPGDIPVTSVYLSIDGKVRPRRQDYELALEALFRRVRDRASELDEESMRSVQEDTRSMDRHVRGEFERGSNRGLAMFSAHGAGLWETVALSRPVRDRATIGPHPDLLQLEALLEVYESFCTVLVDSEKARLFLAELGRIEERTELEDDVPGRHDQGGWSQKRYGRHIDEHRQKHLKRVAHVLFRFYKRRRFDHLILAGPEEVVMELEHELHDYLAKLVRARVPLPMTASVAEVLERSLALEEELERRRERETVDRVTADQAAGRRAVSRLGPTLQALGEGRVGTLVVAADLTAPGFECARCGAAAETNGACPLCGGAMRPVPDVVESAVAMAFRQGARVETVTQDGGLRTMGGIGALLRY
jgi:peptide chain release factor subunit 1